MLQDTHISSLQETSPGSLGAVRIITVEREYGSGGGEIAKALADRLGWKLWDQALTNAIARELNCEGKVVQEHEEKRDPLYYRLLKSFMRGSYEGSQNAHHVKMADTDCIREVTESVVKRAAKSGHCVIVGRGSAYYLQNRRDTFHVFVYAPIKDKVRRLRGRGKSESDAAHLAETVDQERAAFIKEYFGVEWPDRSKFHLMLNSTLGETKAVDIILHSIELQESRGPEGSPASRTATT
ncbi:MAG TPA: cytidylate kinase-like family protein [Dongiaceae bacterium]|nr:cytidylate kinase-like family protein [Dongiaceae bacterium]